MKKKFLILFSASLLLFGAFSLHSFGDDKDPLISKSYLDKKLEELEKKIDEKPSSSAGVKFAPIHFDSGETIIFKEGTEFILRSGEAKIIDPTKNGLADVTVGTNLVDGNALPIDHMLLCPRSDGRGVYCNTEIWIMIKGDYVKDSEDKEKKEKVTDDHL